MTLEFAAPGALLLSLFRPCSVGALPSPPLPLRHQRIGGGHQVAEPVVDDGTGAVVGGREQVGVDAEGESGVSVAEVLS